MAAVDAGAPPAILRVLLRHGADPNQRRADRTPPLILAARRRDVAAVDALILAGADVNGADATGRTALMHAVERGFRHVVYVLLVAGADPVKTTPDGTTALQLAQAWHRQNLQSALGVRHTRSEAVTAQTAYLDLVPTAYVVRGPQHLFDLWAAIVEHAVDQLRSDFEVLVAGTDEATAFLQRLRTDTRPPTGNHTWYSFTASRSELMIVRESLLNLWGGPRTDPMPGVDASHLHDLFEELDAQLH